VRIKKDNPEQELIRLIIIVFQNGKTAYYFFIRLPA